MADPGLFLDERDRLVVLALSQSQSCSQLCEGPHDSRNLAGSGSLWELISPWEKVLVLTAVGNEFPIARELGPGRSWGSWRWAPVGYKE
jgi:hypothetical protein